MKLQLLQPSGGVRPAALYCAWSNGTKSKPSAKARQKEKNVFTGGGSSGPHLVNQ